MTEAKNTIAGVAAEAASNLVSVRDRMDRAKHPERAAALLAGSRLIAAAPDMLEALRPFANATITPDGQIIGLQRADWDRANAAIAKAEG